MGELWKLWVTLAGAGVVAAWLLVARALRRRRLRALEPVARELGLVFHGDSFRGRFRGHAVRGDGVDDVPRGDSPAGAPAREFFLSPFLVGRRAVRVRVELTAQGLAGPDARTAASAARKEIKDRGVPPALCEVSLHGTEVVFILRGEAATPAMVRAAVEKAIGASARG